jgi:hypothetical protein
VSAGSTDVASVPLGLLRRYLRARGWRDATRSEVAPKAISSERMAAYRTFTSARLSGQVDYKFMVSDRADLSGARLAIPADANGPDFLLRVGTAVDLLSRIERRPASAVVRSIRSIGFDAVYSSLPDAVVRSDTVSFETAAEHIAALKTVLINTAMTEVKPVSHFDSLAKAATDYAEACRFGHTFRGSFGFTIESPLAPRDEPALLEMAEGAPPFERRVVTRFARGLQAIQAAGQADDASLLLDGVACGFGANAYEAVAKLIDASVVGVAFDFSFSPEWTPPTDVSESIRVDLTPNGADVARRAGLTLRDRLTPEPVDILGTVVTLLNEQNPQLLEPQGSRLLTLKWISPKHGEIRTRVRVSAEDYLKALRAHELGETVRVRGTLEYRRGWVLVDPSSLLN